MIPGKNPSSVSRMFSQKWPFRPTSRNTPSGGRKIAAIVLPPLGVFLEVGLKGHFWLNILLTLLGVIPGIIHALYVIMKK